MENNIIFMEKTYSEYLEENFKHFLAWLIISLFTFVFSFYNFMSIFKYKNRKLKEDTLNLEKYLLKSLILLYIMFICITQIFNLAEINMNFTILILLTYLVVTYSLHVFISFENYKQIKDPSFQLRSYINEHKWSIKYEIFIVSLTVISVLSCILLFQNKEETDDENFFIHPGNIYYFSPLFIFSILTIIFSIRKKKCLFNYSIGNKKNAVHRNICELITYVLYFLLILYLLTVSIIIKFSLLKLNLSLSLFNILCIYLLISISLIDSVLSSYSIYKSDFYYYYLGNNNFGIFLRMFGNEVYKKPILSVDHSTFNANMKENSVLYFHNTLSYMIEEHLIDTLDNILNISLASLYLIFSGLNYEKSDLDFKISSLSPSSRNFKDDNIEIASSEKSEDKKSNSSKSDSIFHNTNREKLIDKSHNDQLHDNDNPYPPHQNIHKTDFSTPARNTNSSKLSKYENYKFNIKDYSDEKLMRLISLNPDKDSLMVNGGDNSNKNLKVKIKSLYAVKFSDFMKKKNINIGTVKESLISHLNPSSAIWSSLLNKNSKEDYFKKQKKLLLSTYDRLYSFEICGEESIFNNEGKAKNFLKKYFKHMERNNKSFLPLILGVFKIQVNDFQELTLVLTKNIIIQEDPKQYYNYWQMIKIDKEKQMEMITSSKDRTSNIIKDEILFKKDFKLNLSDYQEFQKILQNDLDFFDKMKTKDFNLVIMYYELGSEKNQSAGNIFENNTPPNIYNENYNLPNRISIGNISSNVGANRVSVISKKKIAPSNSHSNKNSDTYNDTKDFDTSSLLFREANLIQLKDNNGFEASYNNFKSILFFTFDNVFKTNNWFSCRKFSSGYLDQILGNFEESLLK